MKSFKKYNEKIEVAQDKDIDDREGSQPATFQKGIKSKSTKAARDAHFKKMTKADDSDPSAYKDAPGDKKARKAGTKESPYTKKFKKMYGESVDLSEDANATLKAKADKAGYSLAILKQVYKRGMAAWKVGHKPGTTPQQWGMARVNSFMTGGRTRVKGDPDLWAKQKGKIRKEEVTEDAPCWDTHKQVGTKVKKGKEVPNCVPKESTGIKPVKSFSTDSGWKKPTPGKINPAAVAKSLANRAAAKAKKINEENAKEIEEISVGMQQHRNEEVQTKDKFVPHMMYDPKTGKGYKAEVEADHLRMQKLGYTHDKPEVKEAFGRARFTQQLKKKGFDVDKVHSQNVKDAAAAKVRSAAAQKDLSNFRKNNNIKSEDKDNCGCGETPCRSHKVDEAMTMAQRRKAAISFKRNKSKIKIGRERAKRRMASKDVLMKRARKAARMTIMKKLTKAGSKGDLDFARREAIEKRLDKMKSKIDQVAKKLYPELRKKEMTKRQKKND